MRSLPSIAGLLQQAAAQIRANLRTPLARPLAERGISAFGGLAGALVGWLVGRVRALSAQFDAMQTRLLELERRADEPAFESAVDV